jgi:hypothetical protein
MIARQEHLDRYAPITKTLQAALAKREIKTSAQKSELAKECGISYSALWGISTGRRIPSPTTVKALSIALGWPYLVRESNRLRTKSCLVCERTFIDSTNEGKRIYCEEACRQTNQSRIKRESERGKKQEHITITKKLLTRHRDAVDAFCRSCCPEGVCDNPSCELRPVSMMPLPRGQQWAEYRARNMTKAS